MDIEYGAEVVDSNGKSVGKIDYLIRDTYTGEISKFKVSTALAEMGIFYTPEEVAEATPNMVKLKIPFEKGEK